MKPKAIVCSVKVGRSKYCLKQFFNLIYKNRLRNTKHHETLFQLKRDKKNTKHVLSRLNDMDTYIHNKYKPHKNALICCFNRPVETWGIGGCCPQIFAKVDLLPIDNYSENEKIGNKKQCKLLQIPLKLLVTLLLSTSGIMKSWN